MRSTERVVISGACAFPREIDMSWRVPALAGTLDAGATACSFGADMSLTPHETMPTAGRVSRRGAAMPFAVTSLRGLPKALLLLSCP
jgi:hypothetical protein